MTRIRIGAVRGIAAGLAAALAPFAPAIASTPTTVAAAEPGSLPGMNDLRAGEYVWQPERAAEGRVEVAISLGSQRAFVYRGGTLIGVSTISSGKKGHETPIGRFEILQKRKEHYSNRYDNAPMPYMQRLNWYGIALHGGHVPDRPASHGCIRLPTAFAKKLYEVTELGGFVFVTEDEMTEPAPLLALARAHADAPVPADRTREWLSGAR